MCLTLCRANKTWPCLLGAYLVVENINIVSIIVIIPIQEEQRMLRSRDSRILGYRGGVRLPTLERTRDGVNANRFETETIGIGDEISQIYDGSVHLPVWEYME